MKLATHTELFSMGGIPMAGNLDTGGIIGLTPEGAELCQTMATRNVSQEEVPASCMELVKHLSKGGYLEPAHDEHLRRIRSAYLHVLLAEQLGATLSFSLLTAPLSNLGTYALTDEQLTELGEASASGALSCEDDVAIGDGTPHLAARRFCGAGIITLSVAADGTVYPCHMLHNPRFAMGSAFKDSADAILESSVSQRFRTLDARAFESCDTCNKRVLCGGGCRARAFLATESLTACDPYCELSSLYYDSIGQQLASRFERRKPDVV